MGISHPFPAQVRERLGAGSFGAVYRAAGPPRCGRRRDFALKAVRAADLAPARRRALERRLTTEAALSISLGKHPQLVGVLYLLPKLASVPSTAGGMLIAMELVRGCDLGAALAGAGALYAGGAAAAGARASSLARQLLGGLAHMHARGVMHQDVKPANLLLDAAGKRLRVSDYGLAAFRVRIKSSTRLQCARMRMFRHEPSAVLREIAESNRFVQKSAESTSM